jgi:hypothetical protein
MKIDQDLRLAIRAAEKVQPANERYNERAAIDAFLKKNKAARKALERATVYRDKGAEYYKKAKAVMAKFGLDDDASYVVDHDTFGRAGGATAPQRSGRWVAEQVIGRLLAADPKDRQKILLEYGIRWE